MPEGRELSPGGTADRSLARSAWNSPTPKEPSRRARYDRAQTRLSPADSDGSGLRAACKRTASSPNVCYVKSLTIPSLINLVAIAAREETRSLANIRRKCVETVHGLISKTSAIVLFG
jgi:hypothetical protein